MKIYNRISAAERIFRGRGIYVAFLPVRVVLSFLYRIIISLRGKFSKKSEYGKEKKISAVVISVGNLVVGGGGKTPCAISLVKALRERGFKPAILTRGYGSRAEKAGRTVVLRASADPGSGAMSGREYALYYGDELAIYRNESVPVILDPNRKRGLRAGTLTLKPTHVIMDDAFQNLEIHKDHDILLLDHSDPFGGGKMLPWGTLRERPEQAVRADIVIFTRSSSDRIPAEARNLLEGKKIFFSRHEYAGIYGRGGEKVEPGELDGRKIALYSGIALPESFEDTFTDRFHEPDFSFRFSDHHMYDEEDIRFMTDRVPDGTAFITTEKDWHKSAELFAPDIDIYLCRIKFVIDEMERLIQLIISS